MIASFDKFTWGVIGVVGLLLVIAVATVNLTAGTGWEDERYVEDGSPEAPVVNAFLAQQQGDLFKARDQYSRHVLEELDSVRGTDPFRERISNEESSRLRIVAVQVDADDPDRALVTFVQDTYSGRGLFNSGSTWSRRGVVEVVREDGVWKINAPEYFR